MNAHQPSGGFRGTSGKIPPEAVKGRAESEKVREGRKKLRIYSAA